VCYYVLLKSIKLQITIFLRLYDIIVSQNSKINTFQLSGITFPIAIKPSSTNTIALTCSLLYYSLCQLTQLEILRIEGNSLNIVPEVVSSLTSLKKLDVWRCELSTLPERFVFHNISSVSNIQYFSSLMLIKECYAMLSYIDNVC